ncbi:MAG TPA: hypothetical protein DCO79_13575 [Spirochaeta sp.]|nr:hypothetical protein [Spirochaeta sp.]
MSIGIKLNGNKMEMPEGSSLYDLILLKKWRLVPMTVKVDGKLVEGKEYGAIMLKNDQDIRIMPFFGGG